MPTRGFALVELVFGVGVAAAVTAAGLVAMQDSRAQASVRSDLSNLRLIAQASAMYAEDNQDRLFTFSWRPGEVPDTPNAELATACAVLNPNSPTSELRAGAMQQLDLVTRSIDSVHLQPDLSQASPGHIPYPLYSHLPLQFYMGESFPSEVFISSEDAARNYWMSDLDGYLADPAGSKYRPPSTATSFVSLWRWAFSSSYATGVSHYSPDFGPPRTVERGSNSNQYNSTDQPGLLGRRSINEVTHPSAKVMMHDQYDRYTVDGLYALLDDARPTMNFYDGHAARLATNQADYGFDPNDPARGADDPGQPVALYYYQPVSWWDPPGSVRTFVAARFDQTRDGLQGADYPAYAKRRPVERQLGQ